MVLGLAKKRIDGLPGLFECVIFHCPNVAAPSDHRRQPCAHRWTIQAEDGLPARFADPCIALHHPADLIAHAQTGGGHLGYNDCGAVYPGHVPVVDFTISSKNKDGRTAEAAPPSWMRNELNLSQQTENIPTSIRPQTPFSLQVAHPQAGGCLYPVGVAWASKRWPKAIDMDKPWRYHCELFAHDRRVRKPSGKSQMRQRFVRWRTSCP